MEWGMGHGMGESGGFYMEDLAGAEALRSSMSGGEWVKWGGQRGKAAESILEDFVKKGGRHWEL